MSEIIQDLRESARRARRLLIAVSDAKTREELRVFADECEKKADELQRAQER